jgi:hypothetical protein
MEVNPMNRLKLFGFLLAAIVIPCIVWSGADRPYDDTTKRLLDNTKDGIGRFKDKIEDKFKVEKIRRGGVEIDVSDYLDDLKKSAEDLKDRYKSDYAAGPDALEFLKKSKQTDEFMSRHQGQTGADTEWLELRSSLVALASAYNIDWESDPSTWNAIRMTDDELEGMVSGLEKAAKDFDKSVEKAAKQAKLDDSVRGELDASGEYFKKATKALKEAVGHKGPAMGAVNSVFSAAEDLKAKVDANGLDTSVSGSWSRINRVLSGVASAFGKM